MASPACSASVHPFFRSTADYIDGKPKQVAKATAAFDYCGISEGIGCDVCAQVCPRLGTREPRTDPRQQLLQPSGPVHDLGHGDILGHPTTVVRPSASTPQTRRSQPR